MDGNVLWEIISDYGFVILTILGSVIVLGIIFLKRTERERGK